MDATEDFYFVKEADLLSVLRPIEVRIVAAACKETSKCIWTDAVFAEGEEAKHTATKRNHLNCCF